MNRGKATEKVMATPDGKNAYNREKAERLRKSAALQI